MQPPPLLPEETLARVLRVARLDGMTVTAFAAVYALLSATSGFAPGAILGLLAAGAGAVELHGVTLLRHRQARGISWLVASQPLLLAIVWFYCATRWLQTELPPIPEDLQPMVTLSAQQWGMTLQEYFQLVNRITAGIVATVATLYQGGMTLYYFRRRHALARAMGEE